MTSRGPYRRHSTPFKLQLCQDIRAGIIGHLTAPRAMMAGSGIVRNCELLANACLCVPVQFFWCGVDV